MENTKSHFQCCLDGLTGACAATCAGCGKLPTSEEGPTKTGSTNAPVRLKACSACQAALYCSKECQKAAWSDHHKFDCALLRSLPEFLFASALQPLRGTIAGPVRGQLQCALVYFFRVKVENPDEKGEKEDKALTQPVLEVTPIVNFVGRTEKRRPENRGEPLSIYLSEGIFQMGASSMEPVVGRLFQPLAAEPPNGWFLPSALAEILRLKQGPMSAYSGYRCCIVEEPWPAFPGLDVEPTGPCLSKSSVLRVDSHSASDEATRRIDPVPLFSEADTEALARRNLAVQVGADLWKKFAFPGSKSQEKASLSKLLFALPGDRILSLYFFLSDTDSPLGLSNGDSVHLVDLNTTTGVCRILSSKGWHLYPIFPWQEGDEDDEKEEDIDRIPDLLDVAEAAGPELAHSDNHTDLANALMWPAKQSKMLRMCKLAMEDHKSICSLLTKSN